MTANKALVIGASSGIGRELALLLAREGWELGIAARRTELLEELKTQIPSPVAIKYIDLAQPEAAVAAFKELITEVGGCDLVIISSGTGYLNPELDWEKEKNTIEVNVAGFAALAGAAFQHFKAQNSGHLAALSSLAALRGSHFCPAYNASKAFVSNYLEGLRKKARKENLPITVTDLQLGLVDTAMAQGEGLFWVEPPQKAAREIYQAIRKKKSHAYVTARWGWVARLLKILPSRLYDRL